MYRGINKAIGPTQSKTAPLKSANGEKITDKNQQLERWVEHYVQNFMPHAENVVSARALDSIENLPIMEELDSVPPCKTSQKL